MWAGDVVDVITASDLAATSTTYTDFSGVSKTSSAVYAGNSAKSSAGGIQLRSKNSNSGIVSTTSGGTVKSVKITVASGSNTIDVYGSNTAYTAASNLYNNTQGTKIGSLTATGTITFTEDYNYVGIRSNNGALYITSIEITWNDGGGSGLEDSDLALTDAPIDLNFDLYSASPQVINYTTSSTGAVTIDESEYATFSINESGKTITVTPKAVTPSAQTITVNQAADETYDAGSTTFTLTITDSTPIPTHTATFSVNGVTSTQDFEEGAAIVFPADPADVSGKTFVGWVTKAIVGTTDVAPDFVTSANMGNSDITYYAVFALASGGGSSNVVDELNRALIGVTGTSYEVWTNKTATSSAVYAGNSAGGNEAIQLRSNNNNSGIVTTTSGGKVKKVAITWNIGTAATRTISIYGKSSAYTNASDLYSGNTQGTFLGDLNIDNANNLTSELTISDDVEYIGIRSKSGALYLDEVEITWSTGGGVSYSDYCTTVVAPSVVKPTITVTSPFTFSTEVTMSCETEGATIYYTLDESDPTAESTEYTAPFNINATTTIKAIAIKDANASSIATVTATKNLEIPTVTIDDTGITNTDVFEGTAAGSLAATVTYIETPVEGAFVTWSGNNDEIATIDAETGVVTLVAAGSVTFTATYAGNSDYAGKTATYVMTVTNSDPDVPGTENNPYTIAQARAAIDAGTGLANVYATGIVSEIVTPYNSTYGNISYNISADGLTTSDQLQAFRGKSYNGEKFTSEDDIQVGDVVVVYGTLKKHNSTYEFDQNNELVSLVRKSAVATDIDLRSDQKILTVGDKGDFEATCTVDAGFTGFIAYSYATSDATIVDLDGIAFSAKAPGTATITVTTTPSGGNAENYKAASQEVEVKVNGVNSIELSETNKTQGFSAGAFNITATVPTENYDGTVTAESSNPSVATASVKGTTVTVTPVAVGTATITVTAGTGTYYPTTASAECAVTVTAPEGGTNAPAANGFNKVTATEDITDGEYLIVYEDGNVAFDGSLETLDASGNTIEVEVTDDVIAATNETKAATFTIDVTAGTIQSKSGYYIGREANSNGLDSDTETQYTNSFEIDGTGNAVITASSGKVLQYNKTAGQTRFRYFGGTQQDIQLYKLSDASPNVTLNASGYATYCSQYPLDFTGATGYSAWQITNVGESTITFEKVTGSVKGGTGLLLKGEASAELTLTYADSENTLASNKLVGTMAPTNISADQYLGLSGNTFVPVNAGNVPAGKALLPVAELPVPKAPMLTFIFEDETTGISEVESSKMTVDSYYDLSGRKVAQPTKGLYIVNGKKVVIK